MLRSGDELGIGHHLIGLDILLSKLLGVVKYIILLVAAQIAHIYIIECRYCLKVLSPDNLQGHTSIYEVILGKTLDEVNDGISLIIHCISLQGVRNGSTISHHKVNCAIDNRAQGCHIVVQA